MAPPAAAPVRANSFGVEFERARGSRGVEAAAAPAAAPPRRARAPRAAPRAAAAGGAPRGRRAARAGASRACRAARARTAGGAAASGPWAVAEGGGEVVSSGRRAACGMGEAARLESLLLLQLRDEKLVLVRDRHARDRAEEGEVRLRGLREGPPHTPSPAGRPLRSQARAAQAGPQAESRNGLSSKVTSLHTITPCASPPPQSLLGQWPRRQLKA